MKKLSICIPVYNNQSAFRHCLQAACDACLPYAHDVEIIVSDNDSEDDIYSIFSFFSENYPILSMKYHRNARNIGMAGNFLQSVSMATGLFCWIIGSDDFVYRDGVQQLLNIIEEHDCIDFVCCNYDLIDLKEWRSEYAVREHAGNLKTPIVKHQAPEFSKLVDSLGTFICPETNNVYMGAVMTGIFRKETWDRVDKKGMELEGFSGLESMYPHCVIYAQGFLHKKAYYCGIPLIVAGEGTREWSTDTGVSFWKSSLPLIYFNILGDMLAVYAKNRLARANYLLCMREIAQRAGMHYLGLLSVKLMHRHDIKHGDQIKPLRILMKYGRFPSFYYGAFPVILKIRILIGGVRK